VLQRLPDDWLEEFRGTIRLRSNRRDLLPQTIRVGPDGSEQEEEKAGVEMQYFPAPFRFCLQCQNS